MKLSKIKDDEIENFSGVISRQVLGKIQHLRQGRFIVLDLLPGGDAPKDFISIYEYGEGLRKYPKTWPKYIAKIGHKWYPIESITEYLLNRIGEVLGLHVAKSKLYIVDNQLRFCSKYFLAPNESLVHGAQIYSACLEESNDDFVEEVEGAGLSRELFTFQFTYDSVKCVFPENSKEIMESFVKLLIFDALVGNNDRHFYNWGVITDIYGKVLPRFSPIYDTARGLFWNYSEEKVQKFVSLDKTIDFDHLNKYIDKSMPKTGWESLKNPNHIELISSIASQYPEFKNLVPEIIRDENLLKIKDLLTLEFKHLLSFQRYKLIETCLESRFLRLKDSIQS
ncbi:MAG: HipA domain-containing protein [Saprospiraceae bacterium]|nr:HipA domain-containing protein [Saprospiraceae bacterium]